MTNESKNIAALIGKIVAILLILAVAGFILFLVIGVATAKVVPMSLPPNPPADQKVFLAQLKSNSKWQVILTTYSGGTGATRVYDQKYYILFNPQTSSDPTLTLFDSQESARLFVYDAYTTAPVNKDFSPIPTNVASADYKDFQERS